MSDNSAELEIKLAFVEQALQKLSDEFYQQQQEINLLKKQNKVLQNQLDSMNESLQDSPVVVDDKPPHY